MQLVRPGTPALGVAAILAALAAAPAQGHTPSTSTSTTTSTTPATPRTQAVDLRFAAVAGDAPVRCATAIPGLGTSGAAAQLTDLRFYVSDVRLVRADGRAVPVKLAKDNAFRTSRGGQGVTLIDLEDGKGACAEEGTAATNASVRGTVPRGRYTGVRWTVGLPPALNHSDVVGAPAPLTSAAMAWSWQFGRKFLKVELSDAGSGPAPWAARTSYVHLGSSGCVGDPAAGEQTVCRAANRASVRLKRFDPRKQRVAFDVRRLVAGVDLAAKDGGGAPGCMSGPTDPECGSVLGALGVEWRPDGSGSGASPTAAATQTVFRPIGR
ncbi:MbnP family copper-binding protein [Conexibacter sp. SYSU D00693]|uniref:MbnP family copper-binding protein n=1 Tax=Conexibacter sp. SYSU D00693 TaxID=2812560 RepID=UPI00196AA549|nr:MbnP family copper-binding protein [Conexibacter sp. SYSU D00693]